LRFLLEGIRDTDDASEHSMIPDVRERIAFLDNRIANPKPNTTGSGDIYGDVLNYAPGGIVIGSLQRGAKYFTTLLNKVLPNLGTNIQDLLGIKTIVGILTATADRRVPGTDADVFQYKRKQVLVVKGGEEMIVVQQNAKMEGVNEWGKERYMSKTFENYNLWKRVFGGDHAASGGQNGN
jgi:hypothetical protein